jgi:hypothetical protein
MCVFLCVEIRGFQCTGIFWDEAAYTDEKIYQKNIIQHKSNQNTWVCAVTTPGGDTALFSRLCNSRKPDGTLWYRTLMTGTCKACRRAGITDKCLHKRIAPWKSLEGINQIEAMVDKATFNQEVKGVVTADQVSSLLVWLV